MAHVLPAPPIIPLTAQELLDQKEVSFYLSTVRDKGRIPRGREVTNEWHSRLVLPKAARFHGLRPPPKPDRRQRPWYKVPANLLGVGHWNNRVAARLARDRIDNRLQPWMVQRIHTLGWGGNGIACLVQGRVIPGAPPDIFVAKCSLNNNGPSNAALRAERRKQRVSRRETRAAK